MLFLLFLKIYCYYNDCHGYDFSPINPLRNFQYTCKQELKLLLFFYVMDVLFPGPQFDSWFPRKTGIRFHSALLHFSWLTRNGEGVWEMENSPYF